MSKECFSKDRKFRKSSKCLVNKAILSWAVARDEFVVKLSLWKSLMSWYLESIETGIKIIKGSLILRFSFGKMFVSLQKRKLEKKNKKTDKSQFD